LQEPFRENQHFSTTPKFADGGEKKHHPNNFWWSTPIFVIKTNFCGQDQFFFSGPIFIVKTIFSWPRPKNVIMTI
jgi:hypothetical protein